MFACHALCWPVNWCRKMQHVQLSNGRLCCWSHGLQDGIYGLMLRENEVEREHVSILFFILEKMSWLLLASLLLDWQSTTTPARLKEMSSSNPNCVKKPNDGFDIDKSKGLIIIVIAGLNWNVTCYWKDDGNDKSFNFWWESAQGYSKKHKA